MAANRKTGKDTLKKIFALQTAMLDQFGAAQSDSFKLMITSTFGAIIASLTFLASVWMIVPLLR